MSHLTPTRRKVGRGFFSSVASAILMPVPCLCERVRARAMGKKVN